MFQKEIFAQRLRGLRVDSKESRQELAQSIDVSVSQISEMENGRKATTMDRFVLLCEHYKVSADYLLGLKDERESALRAWGAPPTRRGPGFSRKAGGKAPEGRGPLDSRGQ